MKIVFYTEKILKDQATSFWRAINFGIRLRCLDAIL